MMSRKRERKECHLSLLREQKCTTEKSSSSRRWRKETLTFNSDTFTLHSTMLQWQAIRSEKSVEAPSRDYDQLVVGFFIIDDDLDCLPTHCHSLDCLCTRQHHHHHIIVVTKSLKNTKQDIFSRERECSIQCNFCHLIWLDSTVRLINLVALKHWWTLSLSLSRMWQPNRIDSTPHASYSLSTNELETQTCSRSEKHQREWMNEVEGERRRMKCAGGEQRRW